MEKPRVCEIVLSVGAHVWTLDEFSRAEVPSGEVGRGIRSRSRRGKSEEGAGRIDNLLMLYVSRDRLDIWSRYLPIL